jgi:hypothetical protein
VANVWSADRALNESFGARLRRPLPDDRVRGIGIARGRRRGSRPRHKSTRQRHSAADECDPDGARERQARLYRAGGPRDRIHAIAITRFPLGACRSAEFRRVVPAVRANRERDRRRAGARRRTKAGSRTAAGPGESRSHMRPLEHLLRTTDATGPAVSAHDRGGVSPRVRRVCKRHDFHRERRLCG